jgi:putative endonuclease
MRWEQSLGKEGEDIAAELLLRKGYEIVRRNYRFGRAEVDIIARLGNILVIVEVKTRSGDPDVDPGDAITGKKIKLLARAAEAFMLDEGLELLLRYDAVIVEKQGYHWEITHIEDAFFPT